MVAQAGGAIFASFTVLGLLASLAHRKRTSEVLLGQSRRSVASGYRPLRSHFKLDFFYTRVAPPALLFLLLLCVGRGSSAG